MNESDSSGSAAPQDENVRRWEIIEASKAADGSALPKLLAQLGEETEANRRHIVRALGNIGGDAAKDRLVRILDAEDGLILGDAARALAKLGHVEALPRITKLTAHETDWVRTSALWAVKVLSGAE